MAIVLQHRRGTESQNNSFTGVAGELTVDTTNKELRLHDGVTLGGKIVSRIPDIGTIAELKLMVLTPEKIFVTGYHTENDGAFGSHFYRLATDTGQVDNSGTIIRTVNGVYELQYSGAVKVKWFGARGDGATDDSAALQNALNAVSTSGTLELENKGYLISSPITRLTQIIINGNGAYIIVDINDVNVDAVTIGNTAISQFNFDINNIEIVSKDGATNVCKNALVLNRTQDSNIDVIVLCATAEYAVVSSGSLSSNYNVNTWRSTSPYGTGRATNGFFVTFDGSNQANINTYNLKLSLHSGIGLTVDSQVNGGQGSVFSGVIEYCGTAGSITSMRGISIDNLYVEENTIGLTFTDVEFSTIKNMKRGTAVKDSLSFIDCQSIEIYGGQHRGDTMTIDGTCKNFYLHDFDLQGNPPLDSGINTRYGTGIVAYNAANTPAYSPKNNSTLVNFASNSNFERWSTFNPFNWGNVGAASWTKSGDGLADTNRNISRYSGKITTTGIAGINYIPDNISDFVARAAGKYFNTKLWVMIPTTTANSAATYNWSYRVRVISTALGNTDYYITLDKTIFDEWQAVYSKGILVPMDVTNIQFTLFLGDATETGNTFYISDNNLMLSQDSVDTYKQEENNASQVRYLNGFSESFSSAVPTTGTWIVGDKVYNNAPIAGGTIGWICTVAGIPGTWKTFGTIGA